MTVAGQQAGQGGEALGQAAAGQLNDGGDGGVDVSTGTSVVVQQDTTDILNGGGASEESVKGTFAELIPAEFRDKKYLADILAKPVAEGQMELLKKFDGAMSLIGRKTVNIPDIKQASDDEMAKFHAGLRFEKPEEYNVNIGVEAGVELSEPQKKYKSAVEGLFFEAGLSPWQAKILSTKFPEVVASVAPAGQVTDAAHSEEEFGKAALQVFGSEARSEVAINRAKNLIHKYAPAEMQTHVAGLDNKSLVTLAAVLDGVYGEYIGNDDIRDLGGNGAGRAGGETEASLRAEMSQLQAKPEYSNSFSPEYTNVRNRVTEISRKLANLQNRR